MKNHVASSDIGITHVESVCEKKKPFKCYLCEASLANKQNMKEHILSVHEGIKPFKCGTCNSTFSHKGNLQKHIRS